MGSRRRGRADLLSLDEYCLIAGRETRRVDATLPCADTTPIPTIREAGRLLQRADDRELPDNHPEIALKVRAALPEPAGDP